MLNAIWQLLPLMVALALSSVPMMATISILLAPDSRGRAIAFLIGSLLGLFVVTGLLTLFAQAIPGGEARRNQPTVGALEIVLGIALIGYAVILFLRRHAAQLETELPKWLRSVVSMKAGTAFWLALALNLRPKSLIITSAAALVLGTSRLPVPEIVVVLVVFAVLSGSTVAVPIVLTLVSPRKMRRPLQATEQWLLRNGRNVTLSIAFLVGVLLIWNGYSKL